MKSPFPSPMCMYCVWEKEGERLQKACAITAGLLIALPCAQSHTLLLLCNKKWPPSPAGSRQGQKGFHVHLHYFCITKMPMCYHRHDAVSAPMDDSSTESQGVIV